MRTSSCHHAPALCFVGQKTRDVGGERDGRVAQSGYSTVTPQVEGQSSGFCRYDGHPSIETKQNLPSSEKRSDNDRLVRCGTGGSAWYVVVVEGLVVSGWWVGGSGSGVA